MYIGRSCNRILQNEEALYGHADLGEEVHVPMQGGLRTMTWTRIRTAACFAALLVSPPARRSWPAIAKAILLRRRRLRHRRPANPERHRSSPTPCCPRAATHSTATRRPTAAASRSSAITLPRPRAQVRYGLFVVNLVTAEVRHSSTRPSRRPPPGRPTRASWPSATRPATATFIHS